MGSGTLAAASLEEALSQGEVYRERGQIYLAVETLKALRDKLIDPGQAARWAGALGQAHYLTRQPSHRPAVLALLEEAAIPVQRPLPGLLRPALQSTPATHHPSTPRNPPCPNFPC